MTDANEIGILLEGQRNDGLTRYGGYLRRKGWEQPAIEAELLHQNLRRCRPVPLPEDEVRGIAASVMRYLVGGPDPLQAAWQAVQGEAHASRYSQFVSLTCHLQQARPDQPVVLPLERIGALMGCDWTSVRGYKRNAIEAGRMRKVADPIPHRRAAQYRVFISSPEEIPSTATATPTTKAKATPETPTIPTMSHYGLVGISRSGNEQVSHSGNGHSGNDAAEKNWEQVVRLTLRGLRLFPCRAESKLPQIKAWQKVATRDLGQLERWFRKFAGANWALACGEASGVWVLDIDSNAAGAAMMRRFQEHGYPGPETLCVRTGREFGYHLYFAYPKGMRIANRTGLKDWHEGLDVRGEGGYVMVPPSIWVDDTEKAKAEGREMRSKIPYTWLQGDGCAIAEAPDWLLEIVGVMSAAETMPATQRAESRA